MAVGYDACRICSAILAAAPGSAARRRAPSAPQIGCVYLAGTGARTSLMPLAGEYSSPRSSPARSQLVGARDSMACWRRGGNRSGADLTLLYATQRSPRSCRVVRSARCRHRPRLAVPRSPGAIAVLGAVGIFLDGMSGHRLRAFLVRQRARPHSARGTAARLASRTFVAGVLLTYAVWQTRFQYMAEHMFFLNRVQHMVMHHLGPFLIALAWPGPTLWRGMPPVLRRMSALSLTDRIVSLIQQPVIAALLFDGLLFLWLYPPMHFIGMIDVRVYRIMNLSMIGDGLLFWFLILDPRRAPPARLSYAVRLVLVMAVQIPQIMLGALIAVVPRDLYPFYTLCGRLYPWMAAGIDQQLGGFVVYFPGAMMSAIAGLILFRWLWIADETDLPACCTHASSVAGPARLPAG